MKYTEEIFNILSKGGFISSNSVSAQVKRLYDAIEEDLPDYYDYYKGIGFYLEGGDGYYYFARKEAKVDLERKLEAAQKWIDYLSFLKTYHSAFGPGFLFRAADIEIQIGCDIELKEKASKLFTDKKKFDEVVGKLLKELESMGLIEKENELDGTYKVLAAFHYIEDLIERENTFTMEEFSKSVNEFLAFRRYDVLKDNGRVSHKQAVEKAYQEYDVFNKTQPIESDFDKMIKRLEKR